MHGPGPWLPVLITLSVVVALLLGTLGNIWWPFLVVGGAAVLWWTSRQRGGQDE